MLLKVYEEYFKIEKVKGFKKDDKKPEEGDLIPVPIELLPRDLEKLTLMLLSPRRYWFSLKQNFTKLYLRVINNGIINGVVKCQQQYASFEVL